jgi:hypothetical protein
MESIEQCYYVTVRKSADFCYQVYASSFEDALACWEHEGDEIDVDPLDSIVLSVRVD